MSGQSSLVSMASFLSLCLLTTTCNKKYGKQRQKNTATVDVVIPSGSTLANCHDQICVGDGSDK